MRMATVLHEFLGVSLRWSWLFASPGAWCGAPRGENLSIVDVHREYVVLLHGLGRSSISMKRVEWALKEEGYCVVNLSYPSSRISVEEAAACVDKALRHGTAA